MEDFGFAEFVVVAVILALTLGVIGTTVGLARISHRGHGKGLPSMR